MKTPALLAFALAASAAILHAEPQKMSFERKGGIFTSALDGKGAKKAISKGNWPDMSPDGTKIAFNTDEPSAKLPIRRIAYLDLATGKTTVFKDIPSTNCFGPVWSPDSSSLLFYIYEDNDWQVGHINVDGTGFRIVKKAAPNDRSFWGADWAADGKSFFTQDMDAIYRMDLNGKILNKWVLADLVKNGTFSSGSSLCPSPDGKSLLIDVDMDEEVNIEGWQGPPPALWLLDLASGKIRRVSPPGVFAWAPSWINDEEIYFNSTKNGDKGPAIYRGKISDGIGTQVLKEARVPTVSRLAH